MGGAALLGDARPGRSGSGKATLEEERHTWAEIDAAQDVAAIANTLQER
jgi:hypothetical protein